MKFRNISGLVAVIGMISGAALASAQDLPPGSVSFRVAAGTNSYAPATFESIPGGFAITNGTYPGWCVQYHVLIDKGPLYSGSLHDSSDTTLPSQLQGEPWDKINYLLNHKQGDANEIQNAIWVILGQSFDPPWTANSQAMVEAAGQFGTGFTPTNGQVRAVIVEPEQSVQRLIIERIAGGNNLPAGGEIVLLSSPSMLTQGDFQFGLSGPTNATYVVEASSDFVNWTALATLFNQTGTVEFRHTNAISQAYHFYRARKQ